MTILAVLECMGVMTITVLAVIAVQLIFNAMTLDRWMLASAIALAVGFLLL
jgi:hypothetical protein